LHVDVTHTPGCSGFGFADVTVIDTVMTGTVMFGIDPGVLTDEGSFTLTKQVT
jgi:hypothetical protein